MTHGKDKTAQGDRKTTQGPCGGLGNADTTAVCKSAQPFGGSPHSANSVCKSAQPLDELHSTDKRAATIYKNGQGEHKSIQDTGGNSRNADGGTGTVYKNPLDDYKSIHTFVGKVIHGKGMGRTVGMPTANIDIAQENITVPPGVYASRISIAAETFTALTNIGRRPSVDDEARMTVEAHILDFDRDIYDRIVTLELYQFLRPIQKFPSLQGVMEQVKKDTERVRSLLGSSKNFSL